MIVYGEIYIITNIINNHKYVGQTTVGHQIRFKRHIREANYHKNRYLSRAIRKYGKENFKVTCLLTCSTKQELDYFEKYFINLYESNNTKFGYNLTLGGEGGKFSEERKINHSKSLKGRIVTKETRQKISAKNKGQKLTKEQRKRQILGYKKFIEDNNGKYPAFFKNRRHSEKSKQLISKNRKGKRVKSILRPIKLIDKRTKSEYIFDCVLDACRELNLNSKTIYNVLNGWSKSLKNYNVIDLLGEK